MTQIPEDLPCLVEQYDTDGNVVVEVLARCINPVVGLGAYHAAIKLRPEARIILRHLARVIEDSANIRRKLDK